MMSALDSGQRLPKLIVYGDELPGVHKVIPVRVFWVSLAALTVAALGAISDPELLAGYDALSWLLLLIPVFLFAYYRGWRGSVRVLGIGTVLLLTFEFAAAFFVWGHVEWLFTFLVALVLLAVGVGSGVLSELLHRERFQALAYAYSDPLTELPNRRLLDFVLDKAFAAGRRGHSYAIVLFGVDRLKDYNARYGRTSGDEALRLVADTLNRHTRRMDTAGRYNGARFLSILMEADRDGAWMFAEKMRERVEGLTLPGNARLTVSAGVAVSNPSGRDWDERVTAAEHAIEHAKVLGGNCTVCAGEY
jgi:diguanylate cyclase (GGDEF)-like protein